jgi:branched-chain amino acid transport system substrate-binding protein
LVDHRGEAKTGIAEFKKLVTVDSALAVIVQRSQIGMAVNPVSKELKTAIIGVVGHPRFLSENPFALRAYPSTEIEGEVLAEEAFRRGIRTIASITLEDEWTLALDDSFSKHLTARGGKVLGKFRFPADEYDPNPIIPKLKASAPDAVFVHLNIPLSGATVRKLREAGIRSRLLGHFWAATPEAGKAAGPGHASGLLYPSVNLDKPIFRQLFSRIFSQTLSPSPWPTPASQPSRRSQSCFEPLRYLGSPSTPDYP